jgi:hypothetical protein
MVKASTWGTPLTELQQMVHEELIDMMSCCDLATRSGGKNRPRATDVIMGDNDR